MCFAQPTPQVTPTNPAPYSVDKAYGAVRSDTITSDGVKHGGWTIAEQAKADASRPPNTPKAPGKSGAANIRM